VKHLLLQGHFHIVMQSPRSKLKLAQLDATGLSDLFVEAEFDKDVPSPYAYRPDTASQ
jgi:hypothetical protein